MNAMNASELFHLMLTDVQCSKFTRQVTATHSPAQQLLCEAPLARCYVLCNPLHNVMDFREIDRRWAVANTLHFFAATENAAVLPRYNKHAGRFLTGDRWIGAYGVPAMPQIRCCIEHLRQYPDSRRAIVTMPGLIAGEDINRPACWNMLHFIADHNGLNLIVYQRSLHLTRVAPYDCVVLTNILAFAATLLNVQLGGLIWMLGNVHCELPCKWTVGQRHRSWILPATELLADPSSCYQALEEGTNYGLQADAEGAPAMAGS